MGSVISGIFSAEECGEILRLGRFASPTQAHLRSTEDECLCTYEHLRISIRQCGRDHAIAIAFQNVQ
jgi:hypothetical protein